MAYRCGLVFPFVLCHFPSELSFYGSNSQLVKLIGDVMILLLLRLCTLHFPKIAFPAVVQAKAWLRILTRVQERIEKDVV